MTMGYSLRAALLGAVALAGLGFAGLGFSSGAQAQNKPLKLGILNDQSSAYSDLTGRGTVVTGQMAIEDFGGSVNGRKIEMISADHQNKADVGVAIATRWFDNEGISAIFDLPTSSVTLAVQAQIASRKDKAMVLSGGFSADLVGKACVANSVQVVPNTYALAKTVSVALVREGFDSWYYIAVDNLGGQSMQGDSSNAVIAAGGKLLGSVRFPINTQDMSSYILQAKATKPKVLGLAMGGNDTVTAMKAASEFGLLADGVRMATYSFDVTDINSVGSATAQGTHVASSFYWDKNDKTRAFAKRFFDRYGKMPTQYQASMYVGLTHYLMAVKETGTDDAQVMIPKMKELKVADFNSESWVRADGSFQRELMLLRAKTPAESKYPWDFFHVVRMVPAADAYKPLAESECPLVRKGS